MNCLTISKRSDLENKTKEDLIQQVRELLKRNFELEKLVSKQKQLESELKTMSLTDDLTGLYNRRGFFTLAGQQLKMAGRLSRGALLLYADIDNLKEINDTLGHHEGGKAIIDAANILRATYRDSDIIARIGGDEFVAFPVGLIEDNIEALAERLQKNIDIFNNTEKRPYKLSISFGIKQCDPRSPYSLDEILDEADRLMYEQKKQKKRS